MRCSAYEAIALRLQSWPVAGRVAELTSLAVHGSALIQMKILTRSNRVYATARFGQPEIRLRHRHGTGLKSPSYILRCGCCDERLEIHYADDGLEIGGVNGALEDWREILLPLLRIEHRAGRFVDVSKRPERNATKSVQRTGASRGVQSRKRKSSAAGSGR